MARFRRRYRIIDHEDANTEEVGFTYVLQPAKNPADLAAMHTLVENVEPELASDLREHIAKIEAAPDRGLGSYGTQCLPHVTHPKVRDFAQTRLKQHKELLKAATQVVLDGEEKQK